MGDKAVKKKPLQVFSKPRTYLPNPSYERDAGQAGIVAGLRGIRAYIYSIYMALKIQTKPKHRTKPWPSGWKRRFSPSLVSISSGSDWLSFSSGPRLTKFTDILSQILSQFVTNCFCFFNLPADVTVSLNALPVEFLPETVTFTCLLFIRPMSADKAFSSTHE